MHLHSVERGCLQGFYFVKADILLVQLVLICPDTFTSNMRNPHLKAFLIRDFYVRASWVWFNVFSLKFKVFCHFVTCVPIKRMFRMMIDIEVYCRC